VVGLSLEPVHIGREGRLIQALRKSGRYVREQYSAPFDTSVSLLFYNNDLLTAAGVTPPVAGERCLERWQMLLKNLPG